MFNRRVNAKLDKLFSFLDKLLNEWHFLQFSSLRHKSIKHTIIYYATKQFILQFNKNKIAKTINQLRINHSTGWSSEFFAYFDS